MSETLTRSEKWKITRRANKAKLEAFLASHPEAEQASRTPAPTEPDFEAKVLETVAVLRAARRDAYAVAASTQGHRRELAREPVVSLAVWRAFVLPPPTHIKGKPVPPPKPPAGPPPAA